MSSCPLCQTKNETVLFEDSVLRIILVTDQTLVPAYCRVIWHNHVAEMTDLNPNEREHLMNTVYRVEQAFRDILNPDKINLASFGTMVPHQHWHIIARFQSDAYYPDSIWSTARHQNVPELPANWQEDLKAALQA